MVRQATEGKILPDPPYGEVLLARYAYQKAGGGKTVCPLEQGARILRNATPRFAKMVAHKLAQNAALDVQRDLEENHGRPVSKLLVQELGAYASAVVQAKEETWTYHRKSKPRLRRWVLARMVPAC